MRISDWVQTCALPISTPVPAATSAALVGPWRCSRTAQRRAFWRYTVTIGRRVCPPVLGSPTRWANSFSRRALRSEEHTSELQSLMRISYAVFCLKKKNRTNNEDKNRNISQVACKLKKHNKRHLKNSTKP